MLSRYVLLDLVRNTRRTLSTQVGVVLGVGLFCGVLFFVDGLSTSMTQRSVAPLAIDMQRILSERIGGTVMLTQKLTQEGTIKAGDKIHVELELVNAGDFTANDVTVRSRTASELHYVPGSAMLDGRSITGYEDNPFAHGPGKTGYNIGTIAPGDVHRFSYTLTSDSDVSVEDTIHASFSTRESVTPVAANQPRPATLDELAVLIKQIEGIKYIDQLSYAELGNNKISYNGSFSPGMCRIFGIKKSYADHDKTISIIEGELTNKGAVLSVEAARSLGAEIGDTVSVLLPDNSTFEVSITGIADLSRARTLFNSRRGADLESFLYRPSSIIVHADVFTDVVFPAYQLAATENEQRLKNPPVREIDIWLDHELLSGSPVSAKIETEQINKRVMAIAAHQDYILDNISNTLQVAVADAQTAKRLFFFLGIPGGFLAAMLAAYAASVLASAQRREQATLRVRGANKQALFSMLALRTLLITGTGSIAGLLIGFLTAGAILGFDTMSRAGITRLATSGILGTIGGFLATGLSLYLTGHFSIERQINEDRARLSEHIPFWRRAGFDIFGVLFLLVGTVIALTTDAFKGKSGSVYFGLGVELNLALLVFPVSLWFAGSLLTARLFATTLSWFKARREKPVLQPWPDVFTTSVSRRPWPIGNAAVIVSLIVALSISLAGFTASYNSAKAEDALYANGSDLRITPDPASQQRLSAEDSSLLLVDGIKQVTPIIYGVQNVILRSARTSDPANMLAVDPVTYADTAPLYDSDFVDVKAVEALTILKDNPEAVIVSKEFADFLQVEVGDTLHVLLERGTNEQTETVLRIKGLFIRLPGCPDGAHALMSMEKYTAVIPSKKPDFFLASVTENDAASLQKAADLLNSSFSVSHNFRIESRNNTLAKDQSSLAALNIAGLAELDSIFALAMAVVASGIFVFGLLLQRRREYITLRSQGLGPSTVWLLIAAEAAAVALGGSTSGILVGIGMGFYFVKVLQPLFIHTPHYIVPFHAISFPTILVLIGTSISSIAGSRLVNSLQPMELLRDE
jgi:putative ABC transport system permease protein